jgi:hypothetical protein
MGGQVVRSAFLGMGTGRCGTTSLAHILNHCHRVQCAHECGLFRPSLTTGNRGIKRFVNEAVKSVVTGDILGDVAFYWTDHAPTVKAALSNLKIIVLWRPVDEVCKSFSNMWGGKSLFLPKDHKDYFDQQKLHDQWNTLFRSYNVKTAEESFVAHHEHTYAMAEQYTDRWPNDVIWIKTEELNETSVLGDLLAFLEVPPEAQSLPVDRRQNPSKRM